jgi:hypothetical protein
MKNIHGCEKYAAQHEMVPIGSSLALMSWTRSWQQKGSAGDAVNDSGDLEMSWPAQIKRISDWLWVLLPQKNTPRCWRMQGALKQSLWGSLQWCETHVSTLLGVCTTQVQENNASNKACEEQTEAPLMF